MHAFAFLLWNVAGGNTEKNVLIKNILCLVFHIFLYHVPSVANLKRIMLCVGIN